MTDTRKHWLKLLTQLSEPIIIPLSQDKLKQTMPIERKPDTKQEDYTHLEAFSRLLVGIAPWLETPAIDEGEKELQTRYLTYIKQALHVGTDPHSHDYFNFSEGLQPIVDSAFLAQALLRAPTSLWEPLPHETKQQIIHCLKQTRTRKPLYSNWLLFSAMIETFLYAVGEEDWDPMRIDFSLKQFNAWYVGDGTYSDGPRYHQDYYNSIVIHPMLVDIVTQTGVLYPDWDTLKEPILTRSKRYSTILERMISPTGTFPATGRSLAYRTGIFHNLAHHAWREDLTDLSPGQLRAALDAVIEQTLEKSNTFNEAGYLTIGVSGHQPGLGEVYISTGSLYLTSVIFLPLGLKETAPFWQDKAQPWTTKRLFNGEDLKNDYPLDN